MSCVSLDIVLVMLPLIYHRWTYLWSRDPSCRRLSPYVMSNYKCRFWRVVFLPCLAVCRSCCMFLCPKKNEFFIRSCWLLIRAVGGHCNLVFFGFVCFLFCVHREFHWGIVFVLCIFSTLFVTHGDIRWKKSLRISPHWPFFNPFFSELQRTFWQFSVIAPHCFFFHRCHSIEKKS